MIPMDFSSVLGAFGQTVHVTDVTEETINGIYQPGESTERTVFGIVLAMTIEQLQFLTEGESSTGGITVTTSDTLYFSDINTGGQEKRQSYVDYMGYRYRVIGSGLMQKNTLHNIYNCIRYIE